MTAPAREKPPLAHGWLALALGADLLLALLDGLSGGSVILTTTYVIVPLALAIVAGPREVALVTGISFTLALASGEWNDFLFSTDHVVRLAVVLIGGFLAVLTAGARQSAVDAHLDADEARGEADAARRRLNAILGSLAEAVTVHDARGKTIYANDAAVRLMECRDADELLAAEPGELAARFTMTREDGSTVRVEDLPGRRAVLGEAAEPMLTRSVHLATGRESWLVTKATVVRDVDGEPLAVNIIEDVTAAKEAERRQRFLADAGTILAGALDARETMNRLARLAVPQLADWCAIDVVAPDGRHERLALAHGDKSEPELDPEISEAMCRDGLAMVVPMRAGERTLGVMTFRSPESGRSFGEADRAFAQDIALRAAMAIESARLYADRAQAAATLQASLLPERLPQLPGWEVSAVYRPGEAGSEVGGDFYDLFEVSGGTMVILGDVTGKGVEAAALTALARHTARTAARFDPDPEAVLTVVDDVLREQPGFALVTVVCALLRDDADGAAVASIVRAGHPAPLLVSATGTVTPLGAPGILLGAVPDARRTTADVPVRMGDTLLFFTDGVPDTPGAGGRFGDARLVDLAAAGPNAPGELLQRIDEAVAAFQKGLVVDDRALLAIQRVAA